MIWQSQIIPNSVINHIDKIDQKIGSIIGQKIDQKLYELNSYNFWSIFYIAKILKTTGLGIFHKATFSKYNSGSHFFKSYLQ